ncbi:alkaline phosphatase D family protein [Roseivivax sp. THAF197b]|uniref:alkaline phosphatase D family protein n=1 Tax=Roseivivax sp. THAF197b TaxID=2588299 RepID=UPI0012695AD5|nr:alkaline phosphatase D family protein [Roseivivax sp. THAF197b]QFS84793.1 PhoD-like phosphatase [Roseivivax sp. THAF197b]
MIGPVLIFRRLDDTHLHLAAIVTGQGPDQPDPLIADGIEVAAELLTEIDETRIWRYSFVLERGPNSGYRFGGEYHPVATDFDGDLRIGFVSCNGEENGDLDRDGAERNAMWMRMDETHHANPFHLLIHGGDQVYADEVTHGHPLTEEWPEHVPERVTDEALDDLRGHLRRGFLHRYIKTYSGDGFARMCAQVPSVMMWDDHDICDGWGSLDADKLESSVGRLIFECAREAFLLFQHGATDADVPELFLDPTGTTLSFRRDLPGVTLLAPDLRSERTKARIMGEAGWAAFDSVRQEVSDRVILISSVPLLGPRLSIVERIMNAIPTMQKYEDDLRDQWQSHAHRAEWQRMLRAVLDMENAGAEVTAVSGEIHLATRATLDGGRRPVHQLVASGISHRAPPRAWAWALGTFARLGEAPLPGHPIRISPLPGQGTNYTAERNFLMIDRQGASWQARWSLEDSGVTPSLSI